MGGDDQAWIEDDDYRLRQPGGLQVTFGDDKPVTAGAKYPISELGKTRKVGPEVFPSAAMDRRMEELAKKTLAEFLGSESGKIVANLQRQVDELKAEVAEIRDANTKANPSWGKF